MPSTSSSAAKVLTGPPSLGGSVDTQPYMPRIVPTPVHIRALQGPWSLEGKTVRMYQEPGTGVLLALNEDGQRVNPLKVISRGKKLGGKPDE